MVGGLLEVGRNKEDGLTQVSSKISQAATQVEEGSSRQKAEDSHLTRKMTIGGRLFEGLRPFVMADVEGRLDEIQAKVMDGLALSPDELVIICLAAEGGE